MPPSRALLSASLLVVLGAVAVPAAGQTAWRTHPAGHLTLQAPADWGPVTVGSLPPPIRMALVLAAPLTPVGRFPNVNVVEEPFEGTAEQYVQANLQAMTQQAQIVRQQPRALGGQAGVEIEARWPANQPPTYTFQRIGLLAGDGITVTCTTTADRAEESRATCTRILASVRVPTNPAPTP